MNSESNLTKSVPDLKTAPVRAVFDETATALYTGISVSSLRKGRMNGRRDNYVEPPPYLKLGRRIVYLKADLDAWLVSHRVEV